MMEREKRKNNLILNGVPEQSSSLNNSQRADLDRSAANSVLELIKPDPVVHHFKLQKLGRFLPHNSKTRSIKVTSKSFWAFVQSKKGSTRIPGVMHFNDSQLTSPEEIVNAFGKYLHQQCIHYFIVSNDDQCPSFASDKSTQLFVCIDSLYISTCFFQGICFCLS